MADNISMRGMPVVTVGGLIFHEEMLLLLKTHKWNNTYGTPGGKVEFGETLVEAFEREIKEETGLDVFDIQFILAQDCIESMEFYRKAHFLLVNYACKSNNSRVRLNNEAQMHIWAAPGEALKLKLNTPTEKLIRHYLQWIK